VFGQKGVPGPAEWRKGESRKQKAGERFKH